MIKVLVVDDHDLVRMGISQLLSNAPGIEVIGEAKNGQEAIEIVREKEPNVVLMDVNMPIMDGLEATKYIVKRYDNVRVLVVTVHADEPYPSRVLGLGALGYITKGAAADDMVMAIQTVHAGHRYLSAEIAQQLALKHLSDAGDSPFEALSEREMEVTIRITSGQKVNDIANQLFLSPKTVNSYRYRIQEKLDVENDVELTHLAIKHGLVKAGEGSS